MNNGFVDSYEMKLGKGQFNRGRVYEGINDLICEMDSKKYLHRDEKRSTVSCRRYKTTAFYSEGFPELTIKDYHVDGNYGSTLIVRCRPAIQFHSDDEYALSEETDYKFAEEAFNDLITNINRYMGDSPLPMMDGWEVNRIDYAFQYQTELYAQTMMMMRKSARTQVNRFIYEARNRGVNCYRYKDSVYIRKSKCTVNFYDKTVEQKCEGSTHVLRFEVQCKSDYLYNMQYKGRVNDLSLRGLWDRELALSVVKGQIQKLIGTGDFYNEEHALNIIENASGLDDYEKFLLADMLHYSVRPEVDREIWWLFLEEYLTVFKLDSKDSKERVRRILRRININEIALPRRWNIDMLPNPWGVVW